MSANLNLERGEALVLAEEPMGSGGEADVYNVISPDKYNNHVAKIFTHKPSHNKLEKIKFLKSFHLESQSNEIILPTSLVYKNGDVCGYIMPKVKGKISLRDIILPNKLPIESKWDGLRLISRNEFALKNRLVVALNIAKILNTLHDNHIVVFDLKPDNILISFDGDVSIIDVDGAQYYDGRNFSPADVGTPEYTPPEKIDEKVPAKPNRDYYIFGIITYQLLFGIHPFMASHPSGFTQEELKNLGYFVHGKHREKITPSPKHDDFYHLGRNIQDLFVACLDEGSHDPDIRPDLKKWKKEISVSLLEGVSNIYSWEYIPAKIVSRNEEQGVVEVDFHLAVNDFDVDLMWNIRNSAKSKLLISRKHYSGCYVHYATKDIPSEGKVSLPLIDSVYEIIAIGSDGTRLCVEREFIAKESMLFLKQVSFQKRYKTNYLSLIYIHGIKLKLKKPRSIMKGIKISKRQIKLTEVLKLSLKKVAYSNLLRIGQK